MFIEISTSSQDAFTEDKANCYNQYNYTIIYLYFYCSLIDVINFFILFIIFLKFIMHIFIIIIGLSTVNSNTNPVNTNFL